MIVYNLSLKKAFGWFKRENVSSTTYKRHTVDDRKKEQEIYSCRYTGIFVDARTGRQGKSKTWLDEQQQGGGGRYVRSMVMGGGREGEDHLERNDKRRDAVFTDTFSPPQMRKNREETRDAPLKQV